MFLIDVAEFQQWAYIIIAVVGALWLWKSGIPEQLFVSSNNLIKIRTIERDDALKKLGSLEERTEFLEKENRSLRREITQRIDIGLEDQDTIRTLSKKLKTVALLED